MEAFGRLKECGYFGINAQRSFWRWRIEMDLGCNRASECMVQAGVGQTERTGNDRRIGAARYYYLH